MIVYPKSASSVMIKPFQAVVKLPEGWKYGTALRDGKRAGATRDFPRRRPGRARSIPRCYVANT